MARAPDCSGALHLGLLVLDLSSIRQTFSGVVEFRVLPARANNKGPTSAGPEENHEEGFYANGGIYNPLNTQTWESIISFPSDYVR